MRVIALTGSVAAGKSTVSALLRQWGANVIDVDAMVRQLQQPGELVYQQIVSEFGPAVVGADGELDRAALRSVMLADPDARRRLEAIVHPAIERQRQELIEQARARGDNVVIVDIPLLFEASDATRYDGVIVVDAPDPLRRERLQRERGLSADEANALMALQLPGEYKRSRADWVIDNDADRSALERRARAVWNEIAA